jgi:Domain of unknown function (DUF6566)
MFFKKRQSHDDAPDVREPSEDVFEGKRVDHGGFGIIPRAKQLYNGNWIARITLVDAGADERRYDFAGPMAEFPSAEEATRVGVEHAIARIDDQRRQTNQS